MTRKARIKPKTQAGSVSVDARDLLRAIRFAMQATERRNSIAVLGTVLMAAEAGRLTVTGTNLDIDCEMGVEAECAAPFATCIGPKALETLARFANGTVTLSLDGDVLSITAGEVKARFRQLMPAEDFPVMKPEGFLNPEGETPSALIPEAVLHKLLGDTIPCISTEETRYYLNGVYMHAKEDGLLRGVATDGHRLALRRTDVPFRGLDGIFLAKAVKILHRALREGGNREIRVFGPALKRVVAPTNGDWTIRMKMIDGTFPDYLRVIPTKEATIEVPLTWEQVRRLRAFAGDGFYGTARPIAFRPEAREASVRSSDGDIDVTVPLHGAHGADFGINSRYLAEFARRHGTIRLESAGSGEPFKVLTEDPDLTLVVMPMRVLK